MSSSLKVLTLFASLFAAGFLVLAQPALSAPAKSGGSTCVQTNDVNDMSDEEFRRTYQTG